MMTFDPRPHIALVRTPLSFLQTAVAPHHGTLRRLLDAWKNAAAEGRSLIDDAFLAAFAPTLKNIWLGTRKDGRHFVEIGGSAILDAGGKTVHRRYLDDIWPAQEYPTIREQLDAVYEGPGVAYTVGTILRRDAQRCHGEQLVLPVWRRGPQFVGPPSHCLGALLCIADPLPDRREVVPARMLTDWLANGPGSIAAD